MDHGSDLEPTPLRLRLGHRVHDPFIKRADETTADDRPLDAIDESATGMASDAHVAPEDVASDGSAATDRAGDVEGPQLPPSWHEQLEQAAELSARRMDRWIVEQRRRVADGLDSMLIQLEERRQAELARLEAWKIAERERAQQEIDEERERFHARLLNELMAFEEQLGLRLREQEERLARWWDEAEEMAAKRFAAVGLDRRAESPEEDRRST